MNLRDFVSKLHLDRQICSLAVPVHPKLELAALTWLACRAKNNCGLLFNSVVDSKVQIATNLFGSQRRMAAALDCPSLAAFGCRLQQALHKSACADSATALRNIAAQQPRQRLQPVYQYDEKDLTFVPQLRFWPREERTFLTLAVVITRSAEDQTQNYGLYRVGVAGPLSLTLNLLPGAEARRHLQEWHRLKQAMPVAIILGADPGLIFAAAASLPSGCDESRFCSFLQQQPFAGTPAATIPLELPSSAQIVIEGSIKPDKFLNEGPFGCFTGDYGGGNLCPVIDVGSIKRVSQPLLPMTLAGPLPMEDCWLAKANQQLLRARLALDLPHIELLNLPLETAFYGLYYVRSSQPKFLTVDLAEQLRHCGYFNRLHMLVKLESTDPQPTASNWRTLIIQARKEQIWRVPSPEIDRLLSASPSKLAYPQAVLNCGVKKLERTGIVLGRHKKKEKS